MKETEKDILLEKIAQIFNEEKNPEDQADYIFQAMIESGLFDVDRVIKYNGLGK